MIEVAADLEALRKVDHLLLHSLGEEGGPAVLAVILYDLVYHTRGYDKAKELNGTLNVGTCSRVITSRGGGVEAADTGVVEIGYPKGHIVAVESVESLRSCGDLGAGCLCKSFPLSLYHSVVDSFLLFKKVNGA